ncbi:hypothetical protein GBA65_12595 [Rubrobacter marinus]|uniref:Uncharacterized protein n=1 Tax=Rubrobacter marinus TaxID=2653852 RepID=A0A6G8PYB8_9ACTN|nr:hypothetical protein [Rubrobacter marinus]QIN79219.1 hypothetical protein GBA65_12595 [Rubrobacter marinus]
MDLPGLYGISFVDWEAVAASWGKRTVPSRLLLFAARRYLSVARGGTGPGGERVALLEPLKMPREIKEAFASPPDPEGEAAPEWGAFADAAVAAELETISYGERPILLGELRAGFERAAEEAGPGTALNRWFLARRDALPGDDLPGHPEYLPV